MGPRNDCFDELNVHHSECSSLSWRAAAESKGGVNLLLQQELLSPITCKFFLPPIQVYMWMQPDNQSLWAKHMKTPTILGRMAEVRTEEPQFLLLEAERKSRETSLDLFWLPKSSFTG